MANESEVTTFFPRDPFPYSFFITSSEIPKAKTGEVVAIEAHDHDATGIPGSYYIERNPEALGDFTEVVTEDLILTKIYFGS